MTSCAGKSPAGKSKPYAEAVRIVDVSLKLCKDPLVQDVHEVTLAGDIDLDHLYAASSQGSSKAAATTEDFHKERLSLVWFIQQHGRGAGTQVGNLALPMLFCASALCSRVSVTAWCDVHLGRQN